MRTSDIAVNVCGFGLIVPQNLRKLALKSLTPQSSRDRPRSARQYVPPCNAGPQAQPAVHGTKNSLLPTLRATRHILRIRGATACRAFNKLSTNI